VGWELRIQVPVSILHDEEKNTRAIMDFRLLQMWVGAEQADISDEGARSRVR
jgi:hypothetical protein